MAKVTLTPVGTMGANPQIYIRESSEPSTADNRYISGTIPGEIIFRAIADNTIRTYIATITTDACPAETAFDVLEECNGVPGLTAQTDCNSYNPETNQVNISVNPTLAGASNVRLVIQSSSQIFSNEIVPVGTATIVKVQANTPLVIRVENTSYQGCTTSQNYTAACSVPCGFTISISTPKCNSTTEGEFDLTIKDTDPGIYTYSVKDAGTGTERLKTIVFGNAKFDVVPGSNDYIVTVGKSGCPPKTLPFTLQCQNGGCNRLTATAYTIRSKGYTSFTDLCAKYCNNQYDENTVYFSGLTVGSTVYSLSTGCATYTDGYYAVVDAQKKVIVLIRIQGGKITETQPACNCSNPTLSADITVQNPICNASGTLTDATVYITNTVNAQKYRVCEAATFTCSNDCSNAPSIANNYASLTFNAPAQGQSKTYVIRIYNTAFGCDVYRDYPITITSPICCVTYEINTGSNSSTSITYKDCSGASKSEVVSGSNTRKKVCTQQGSLTVSGVATFIQTAQGCDTSAPCSLSFQRTGLFCENNLPKVRYTGNGGVVEGDYQIKVGDQTWVDFNQNRVHTLTGEDNKTYNIQIRLKSNNSCIVNDTVTFTTNCTNTGEGCSKPTLTTQYLGSNNGVGFSSPVDACENACNGRVQYGNYYSASLTVGVTVYKYGNNNPNDCSTLGDGWYVGITNVYRIQGGIITEINPHCFCGEVPTLSPSVINGVVNGTSYEVLVGYNCTTSGVKIFKNGAEWKYLAAGIHKFTFDGSEVNNGDRLTAKTVCGDRQSGSSNEVIIGKGGTVDPPPVSEVCTIGTVKSNGGYEKVTKNFNITFNGTVFYMLSTGGIPDQLTVKKNGTTVVTYLATSWRTAGSISVNNGDQLVFEIDGTVTGISGTGWTFYVNCTTPYDVNANYGGDQDRNNERPTVTSIDADCIGTQRRFIVNAVPASATGSPVVQYKLLNNTRGSSDGQFTEAEGWQNSNILTKTIGGNPIEAGKTYSVYMRDQAGKFFGISQVINNATCTSTPTCDKSGLITVAALWNPGGYPFGQSGEARNGVCSGNAGNVTIYPKNSLTVGSKVFLNTDTTNCLYVPNGWYVTPDANFNPSKIVRVIDSSITEIVDFTPCSTNATCNKSGIAKVTLRNNLNGTPFSSCADANAKFCASQAGVIEAYLTGTSVGSKVYFNADLNNCSSIANGFYINPDFSNAANSKIYGIFDGVITQICNFNPC